MNSARPTTSKRQYGWRQLVVFDASCSLCRRSVAFLLRHETSPQTLFARLQSPLAERLGTYFSVDPHQLESVWLIREGRLYMRSEAMLRISEGLHSPWSNVSHLRYLPMPLRDGVYRIIGRYRRQWVPPYELGSKGHDRMREMLTVEESRLLGLPQDIADAP
ncbi:thiol-disulfide oxidoreductase DCC family protein [Phytohalomonas tamaricis]|uniref:thiol-disulfide oxidoreductase DCC family protein n=1 Tax=Phytohalomonas tamaricis TaxID=2081032 RepID=UPI00131A3CF9|nr:DUF393 domain-containing protein [Phytohalomonas tamaricis]